MLNIVHQDVFVHDFSEIGVIMLMFIAGMECELELLKKYAKPSVMVAILGIVLPVGFTMLIGQLFAFSWKKLFPWVSFSSNVGQHFSRSIKRVECFK